LGSASAAPVSQHDQDERYLQEISRICRVDYEEMLRMLKPD